MREILEEERRLKFAPLANNPVCSVDEACVAQQLSRERVLWCPTEKLGGTAFSTS